MTDKAKPPVSGVITFDSESCTGCGTCELVCSSRNGIIINPKWSCITIYYDPTEGEARYDVCNQCAYPACVYACPSNAMVVDHKTGTRYMDRDRCVACGACQKACPFTPERAMIKSRVVNGRKDYFKCDLCRDQDEGPQCVQFCPAKALRFVTAQNRKKGYVKIDEPEQEKAATTLSHDFFKPESEKEG